MVPPPIPSNNFTCPECHKPHAVGTAFCPEYGIPLNTAKVLTPDSTQSHDAGLTIPTPTGIQLYTLSRTQWDSFFDFLQTRLKTDGLEVHRISNTPQNSKIVVRKTGFFSGLFGQNVEADLELKAFNDKTQIITHGKSIFNKILLGTVALVLIPPSVVSGVGPFIFGGILIGQVVGIVKQRGLKGKLDNILSQVIVEVNMYSNG